MDSDTLDAFKATWERARAERIILEAKLDTLVFLLCEELKLDYDDFMKKLKAGTDLVLAEKLVKEEDRNPSFAARVRGWLDREIPNFPLDAPPSRPPSDPPTS
jgi:hypothetical protein